VRLGEYLRQPFYDWLLRRLASASNNSRCVAICPR
jgi:hypothetical protein